VRPRARSDELDYWPCRQRMMMSDDTVENEIMKVRLQRDAKFSEIMSCLQLQLYTSPASEADLQQLLEEAEELTDNWAVAELNNRLPELNTELQVLLNQHQEICKRIIPTH
jgi:hypothetical protein